MRSQKRVALTVRLYKYGGRGEGRMNGRNAIPREERTRAAGSWRPIL